MLSVRRTAPWLQRILMRKVNLNEIKEELWQSPGRKYAATYKGISEAMGREPSSLDLSKRHPFDLEWNRVPPGKPAFPYHAHSAQWELYLVVSGKGSVRHKDGTTEIVPGDAFLFGPDEPHQLSNSGQEELVYYVIADNPIGESNYYPDSGKWKVNKSSAADRVVVKGRETDYFDGEE
jgi:uncharacterized cupin superfamily protein